MLRFTFDVEAQDLHKEGFAFGYVVTLHEKGDIVEIEKGACYSIEGAKASCPWVLENVVPNLDKLTPYLNEKVDLSHLPKEIVLTTKELRERFYEIYLKWKKEGAEFWTDVGYPVETNFLAALTKDGEGKRDWDMPYPLLDVANFLDVKVARNEYSHLKELRLHDPLDDARASAYSLHLYEQTKKKEIECAINRGIANELARRESTPQAKKSLTLFS